MKTLLTSVSLISGLLLAAMGSVLAQEPAVKKIPVRPTQAISGQDLYREFCAVCHGTAGKGDGPAAAALKTPPADLTLIASHNGGKFPEVKVKHIIEGETERPVAHGSKDMPVWGNVFRHMGASPDLAAVRVYNLMKYLETMQAK